MNPIRSFVVSSLIVFVLCNGNAIGLELTELRGSDQRETILNIFRKLASIRRPANESATPATPHDAVNRLLKEMVEAAARTHWKNSVVKPSITFDAYGNAQIIVPGTNQWTGIDRTISLQGHTDMVEAVSDELKGEPLAEVFKNGVELEVVGEWLRSKGQRTTIGVDNGAGVSLALSYLFHPEIAHPRLAIDLTRDEESGLFGANQLETEFSKTGAMINLDHIDTTSVATGCMGYSAMVAKYDIPLYRSTGEGEKYKRVTITLNGLTGGHSGIDVHLKRMNANRVAIDLLYSESSPSFIGNKRGLLLRYEGGQGFSAIPTQAKMELALPEEKVHEVRLAFEKYFNLNNLRSNFPDEDFEKTQPSFTWEVASGFVRDEVPALSLTEVGFLHVAREGVLKIEANRGYDFDIRNSSNNGVIRAIPNYDRHKLEVEVKILFRSHVASDFRDFEANVREVGKNKRNFRLDSLGEEEPWIPAANDWLSALAAQDEKNPVTLRRINATYETGTIHKRFPRFPKLVMGFRVEGEHTPKEQLHLPSMAQTIDRLNTLLVRVGTAPQFGAESQLPTFSVFQGRPLVAESRGGGSCGRGIAGQSAMPVNNPLHQIPPKRAAP